MNFLFYNGKIEKSILIPGGCVLIVSTNIRLYLYSVYYSIADDYSTHQTILYKIPQDQHNLEFVINDCLLKAKEFYCFFGIYFVCDETKARMIQRNTHNMPRKE